MRREQRAVQAFESEASSEEVGTALPVHELGLLGLPSVVDQGEQLLQAVVEEEAVAGLGRGQRHLFELPQDLEAVAASVLLGAHGQALQLAGPGLGVEQEQQSEQVDQAVLGQLLSRALAVEPRLRSGALVMHPLVA